MASNNFEDVAKQFIEFYYQTFDTDRKTLNSLYVSTKNGLEMRGKVLTAGTA